MCIKVVGGGVGEKGLVTKWMGYLIKEWGRVTVVRQIRIYI